MLVLNLKIVHIQFLVLYHIKPLFLFMFYKISSKSLGFTFTRGSDRIFEILSKSGFRDLLFPKCYANDKPRVNFLMAENKVQYDIHMQLKNWFKIWSDLNPHTPDRFTLLTRPLRKKLRIRADSSLIRQKIGTFLYKMMWIRLVSVNKHRFFSSIGFVQ